MWRKGFRPRAFSRHSVQHGRLFPAWGHLKFLRFSRQVRRKHRMHFPALVNQTGTQATLLCTTETIVGVLACVPGLVHMR